jgi:DNA-binding transcriptional MerR regulator
MRGVKPTPEVLAEALRLYEHEPLVTVAEIAERASVDRKSVRSWARDAGLTPRPPARVRTYSAEDDALAVRLYLQEEPRLTIAAVSAATGMCASRVLDAVRAAGAKVRSKGRPLHDHAEVVRLDKEHGPNKAATLLGCSPGDGALPPRSGAALQGARGADEGTETMNAHMMEIAAMAKAIYEGTEPEVPWEQADPADVEAALGVVLASARLAATVKETQRAREGLERIKKLRGTVRP